jgi:hypothetical protein
VRIDVAFTPREHARASLGIVVDAVPRSARMVGSAAEIVA